MNRKPRTTQKPFKPKPMEKLQAQFPRAIRKTWKVEDLMDVESGKVHCPGYARDNIFDTPNGLRLIISREDHSEDSEDPAARECIHFSASVGTEELLDKLLAMRNRHDALISLRNMAWLTFTQISQHIAWDILHASMGSTGIPHWFLKPLLNEEDMVKAVRELEES